MTDDTDRPLPSEPPHAVYPGRDGGVMAKVVVPTIRWFDNRERDLFLAQRRAEWAFDGRKR